MIIRNSKNLAEQEAKRIQMMKLLELEVSNESFLEKKNAEYRNPNAPPPVPPKYRDANEIAKDILGNQLRLINLLTTWGFTNQKANAIVKNVKSNDDILKLLQSSGNLKRKIDNYNKELLSVEFVSNIIEKFLNNYDKTMGGDYEDAMYYLLSSVVDSKKLFPKLEQTQELKSLIGDLKDYFINSGQREFTTEMDLAINNINEYEKYLHLLDNYETLKESGDKSETMAKLDALFKDGKMMIGLNFIDNIKLLRALVNRTKNGKLKNTDAVQEIKKLNESLTLSPEAKSILESLKSNIGLPPDATDADVIKATESKVNEMKKELVEKTNESLEKDKIINLMELKKVENGSYIYGNPTRDQTRTIIDNEGYKTKQGIDNKNIIKNYFLDQYSDGMMSYKEIEEKFKFGMDNPWKQNKNRQLVPQVHLVDDEIDASINIQSKINPIETLKSSRGINRFLELDDLYFKPSSNKKYKILDEREVKEKMKNDVNENIDFTKNSNTNYKSLEEVQKELNDFINNDTIETYNSLLNKGEITDYKSLEEIETELEKKKKELYDLQNNKINNEVKNSLDDIISTIEEKNELETIENELETLMNDEKINENYSDVVISTKEDIEERKKELEEKFKTLYEELTPQQQRLLKLKLAISSRSNAKTVKARLRESIEKKNYKIGDIGIGGFGIKKNMESNSKGFQYKKIKLGKGLELDDEPKFISFGKYLLNKPHLYNNSKLTLRFPSGGAIPTIKPIEVSEDFREFLIDLIETGKTNEPLYKSVPKEEKLFFQKISKGAGLIHKLGVKQIQDDSDKKDLDRYKLLFGELQAGNNNKQMIQELKGLIIKFINNGRMKRSEGQSLLFELSQI